MRIIAIGVLLLALSAAISAQEIPIEQPGDSKIPKTITATDLTKEFVDLAGDTIDSMDRVRDAEKLTVPTFEKAQMDSKTLVQKLNRVAKTTAQKYIADSITLYGQSEQLHIAEMKLAAVGENRPPTATKQLFDREREFASCLITGATPIDVASCDKKSKTIK
jgi:hypothetical protein